jgi:hypothetical protein
MTMGRQWGQPSQGQVNWSAGLVEQRRMRLDAQDVKAINNGDSVKN